MKGKNIIKRFFSLTLTYALILNTLFMVRAEETVQTNDSVLEEDYIVPNGQENFGKTGEELQVPVNTVEPDEAIQAAVPEETSGDTDALIEDVFAGEGMAEASEIVLQGENAAVEPEEEITVYESETDILTSNAVSIEKNMAAALIDIKLARKNADDSFTEFQVEKEENGSYHVYVPDSYLDANGSLYAKAETEEENCRVWACLDTSLADPASATLIASGEWTLCGGQISDWCTSREAGLYVGTAETFDDISNEKITLNFSILQYDLETDLFAEESELFCYAESDWEGSGTQQSPYLLKTTGDLETLSVQVNEKGQGFSGIYFRMEADITLPVGWTPIGCETTRFEGYFDGGGHQLTIPAGEKCLFGYVRKAKLSNLDIYGTRIASAGVVRNYTVDNVNSPAIDIENVTLKSGTRTLESGFIGGYASSYNEVTIKNCVVEAGVIIGYDKSRSNIGSFGGDYNGMITNCTSSATIYGVNYVGGISGSKGQSMGNYEIRDCVFRGKVIASGNYAGGISGGGYAGTNWGIETAPNTRAATIENCSVYGSITGADYVGGILGAEPGIVQCWDASSSYYEVDGSGYIRNNKFNGTVSATQGSYVGGIIGYFHGLNRCNIIENNIYYGEDLSGIGFVRYIDTNCENPTKTKGVIYYSTEGGYQDPFRPEGATMNDYNRTDDPLGADASVLARCATDITVTFSLLGDKLHDSQTENDYHTLIDGNLQVWIPDTVYNVGWNATVYEVLKKALENNGMCTIEESTIYGLYISGIQKNKDNPETSLSEFDNGPKSGWMYTVNGEHPGVGVTKQYLKDGDVIVFHYTDDYSREHKHIWVPEWNSDETSHWHECGNGYCYLTDDSQKNGYGIHEFGESTIIPATCMTAETKRSICQICGYVKEEALGPIPGHQWDAGTVTKDASCTETGTILYKCTIDGCGAAKTETIPALGHTAGSWIQTKAATCIATGMKLQKCSVCQAVLNTGIIPAAGHKFGSWTKVSDATVFAAEVQKHTCAVCGYSETKSAGVKLAAILEVPDKLSSFSMKKGKTEKFTLTMANGDSVSSVTSDNAKYVKVASYDKKGTISLKAVKSGSAKITIRLASGKTRTYTVKVTSGTVKTTKVTVPNTKVTLEKGKTLTLKPVLTPFTSTQKITYKSSNKKVAAVTSAGKIKAVAPGTAQITVTSGSKKVTVTVTVPGITNVKSSVTVKRNKALTLKPKLYGISGKVSYTSSNTAVATVDANGKIRGIKKGTVTITLKAGSYSVKCKVKVQ